ncbi:MAG: aspartate/glutamate racemase family protein [Fodinibius sp.]|nr:aspartate/glutamate racemase family protein [Fodinibius sp.]
MNTTQAPIGIFDSGYGGLTVMKDIVHKLPGYDYLYLGDNARSPYGSRSFDTIYDYTLQCVKYLFAQNCHLIILACNTASAKALRNIQQNDLPQIAPDRRVLGVIRPTAEVIGNYSDTGHVGVLGTSGTISSGSYVIEIQNQFPELEVYQQACPMWVPLVENQEYDSPGADYFVTTVYR